MLLIVSINISNMQFVFAAVSITLDSFTVKVNSWSAISWTTYANPWDILSIYLSWINNWTDATSPEWQFSFSNTQFSYYQPWTIDSYIEWSPVNSDISTSLFNPPSDNTVPIWTSLLSWETAELYYLKLQLNSDASNTSFDIWAKLIASWYSWSNEIVRTVYVNTRPHIKDYYFSTSSLKNNGIEAATLTVKVKDYNGCTNIDWWVVTADLSQLWYSNLEPLTYNSCDADGKTAYFVKNNIQTTVSTGDKTFWSWSFIATDENSNTNMPNDPNTTFDVDDKLTNITLTVNPATYPVVTISNVSDTNIWPSEPATPDSIITFSGDQTGDYKVVINWNWSCSAGTIPLGYDWWSYNTTWASATVNINASDLNDWANTIYVCVRNLWLEVGSANTTITKDSTNPSVTTVIISPTNVVSNNSLITFKCTEDWHYKVCHNTPTACVNTPADWTVATANTTNNVTITNWILAVWSNDFTIWCRDSAYNEWSYTWITITKQQPTPSMNWAPITISDNDTSWDWVDGRDVSITWDTATWTAFSWFQSWRVYLLPSTATLNSWHTYVKLEATSSVWSWTWASTLTTDSSWTTLTTWQYKACVAIMWSSWELWEAGCSSAATLTWDVIAHPSILSARFTSDTNIELTTDATLKTSTWEHTATWITFTVWWTTYTWTTIASISTTKINITIPSLNNTSATWASLVLQTWAIRANEWWYNNYFSSWSLIITDSQAPTVSAFTKTTSAGYTTASWAWFYSWSIALTYTFSEEMKWWWSTYLELSRESGNNDATTKYTYLTNSSDLTSWAKSKSIDLTTQSLVSWTCYRVRLVWQDANSNSTSTSYIWNICWDTGNPTQVNSVPYPNSLNESDNYTSNTTPTLSWFSASDGTNESWIQRYRIQVSTESAFAIPFTDVNTWWTSYTISPALSDGTYYWRVKSEDNMNNTWSWSTTRDFIIDSTVPTISNATFNSITRWTSSITHESWWNVISLTATITNSSWWCITADMSPFWWTSSLVVDSYSANTATWTWFTIAWNTSEWIKSITITAYNTNCVWGWSTQSKNLTIDNTVPVIWTWLTFPLSWNIISWSWTSTTNITWSTASITENNFDFITLDYFDWSSWNQLATSLTNNWQYSWDAPASDISTAKIRMTVRDKAGHTATQTWTAFTIDSTSPTVNSSAITYPNWSESFKWSQSITITWSWNLITDTNLSSTWISLYYSIDNGSNWTLIASGEANDWSYSWTSPASTNTTAAKIKIIARDVAWNTSQDESDWVFTIDSVVPTISTRQTQDLDSNGKIDAIKITLSENISDASVTTWNFWISWWYTVSWFTPTLNWDSANNNIIYLSLNEIAWNCNISDQSWCDTNATPALTYTAWTLTDIAWNSLATNSATISDLSKPIILGRKTKDLNWNGALDAVEITFSENMDASQVVNTSFQLTTSWNWTLTESYDDTTDDKTLLLKFTDGTAFDTSDLTKSKIVTNDFMDLAWNYITPDWSFVSSTNDWAAPIFSANTQWTSTASQIKVTFSENITLTNTWTWTIWNWVTITWTSTWSNYITFTTSNIGNTWLIPTVTYSVAWNISDSSSNTTATWSVTASDEMNPEVSSITILDSNSNGNVDTARIVFTENISDSTVNYSEYAIWWINWTSVSTWTWSNDSVIEIAISSELNWTLTRDVIYTAWSTQDANWNSLASVTSWTITEIDWAGPAIISAYYIEWATVVDDELIINFSENINDAGLALADFWVTWWWAISNAAVNSVTANDTQIKIELNAWDTRLTAWTSQIKFSWAWVITDLIAWTLNTQTWWTVINWSVIINEINWAWSSSSSADEWIELKNMSSNPVSVSWWVITNTTNPGNITIPSWSSIPWNWYFLVSNFAATDGNSKLNITPDYVTTSIDLLNSWNWNIVLQDSQWNTMDSAKWDTWPSWTWTSPISSMERNDNPWDWLTSTNWHSAVANTNLDWWAIEKGTPWTWNVVDATPPSLDLATRTPTPNTLNPEKIPAIKIDYSDSWVWIDTTNTKLYLDWDGNTGTSTWWTNWCETLASSASVTSTSISVTPSSEMTWWRKRACVVVLDNAWNSSTAYWDFWIDNLTMTVSEVSPANFNVIPTVDSELTWISKITITTYWAWIDLRWWFPQLSMWWWTNIAYANFEYDSKLDLNTVEQHTYNWYLTSSGSATIETISKVADLQSDPNLKTYEIYMKYKINVWSTQSSWIYTWSVAFEAGLTY